MGHTEISKRTLGTLRPSESAGRIGLRFMPPTGLQARVGPSRIEVRETSTLTLTAGLHTVHVRVDRAARRAPLRVELIDVPNSDAQARLSGGR